MATHARAKSRILGLAQAFSGLSRGPSKQMVSFAILFTPGLHITSWEYLEAIYTKELHKSASHVQREKIELNA